MGFPTRLYVLVPRFTCTNPARGRKIFQTSLLCADDGAKLTPRVTRQILQCPAVDRMSVPATVKNLGVGRELVSSIAVTGNLVCADPAHLSGVRFLGVDEHMREAHPLSRRAGLGWSPSRWFYPHWLTVRGRPG